MALTCIAHLPSPESRWTLLHIGQSFSGIETIRSRRNFAVPNALNILVNVVTVGVYDPGYRRASSSCQLFDPLLMLRTCGRNEPSPVQGWMQRSRYEAFPILGAGKREFCS